jgi:hypothetical protein
MYFQVLATAISVLQDQVSLACDLVKDFQYLITYAGWFVCSHDMLSPDEKTA